MSDYVGMEWRSYQDNLLQGAPPIQIQETRRAFYAGASSFMNIMFERVSQEGEITASDEQLMDDLQAEFRRFLSDVLDGKA
jgi:hypothetical protein